MSVCSVTDISRQESSGNERATPIPTPPQPLFRASQLIRETDPYMKRIYGWLLIDTIQQDMGIATKHLRFSRALKMFVLISPK